MLDRNSGWSGVDFRLFPTGMRSKFFSGNLWRSLSITTFRLVINITPPRGLNNTLKVSDQPKVQVSARNDLVS